MTISKQQTGNHFNKQKNKKSLQWCNKQAIVTVCAQQPGSCFEMWSNKRAAIRIHGQYMDYYYNMQATNVQLRQHAGNKWIIAITSCQNVGEAKTVINR